MIKTSATSSWPLYHSAWVFDSQSALAMQVLHDQDISEEPLALSPQPLEQADVDKALCKKLARDDSDSAAFTELSVSDDKAAAIAAAADVVKGSVSTEDARPGILEYHEAYKSVR